MRREARVSLVFAGLCRIMKLDAAAASLAPAKRKCEGGKRNGFKGLAEEGADRGL